MVIVNVIAEFFITPSTNTLIFKLCIPMFDPVGVPYRVTESALTDKVNPEVDGELS